MFRTVQNVTLDSEDRTIQIVSSSLSFNGQLHLKKKKCLNLATELIYFTETICIFQVHYHSPCYLGLEWMK